ncbi:MAG: hypothetical protein HOK82_21390 [Rhodospirillaceae bacterium]|jgi:hypothetical protein|nr:hypothetical protein [Rhodospirillaceae bacterium]
MSDAQFIKAPNNLRKAKIGNGPGKLDPSVLARAEKVIENIQATYTDWADEELTALDAVVARLTAEEGDQGADLKVLYTLSLDMKGSGGSFGYLMMSEVAASLNDFLQGKEALAKLDIEVVAAHVSALRAIYAESIRDDGGNMGRALLVGLEKIVAKANAASASD